MRTMKKMSAALLSAAMVFGLMAGNGTVSFAAEKVEKEETVYVNQRADGTVNEITVSDWLKNVTGKTDISDVSDLTDIQNVKGNEAFIEEDNKLIWKADNADIYYQGKTDRKLPVGMKVSYQLDGKKMAPSELAGESGKMTMTIQYENYCISEDKIDTPFMMTSAIILPIDKFSNVTISQGKLVSEGTNQILLAYGMPGFAESLNLSDDLKDGLDKKLSDTVTITADVKDFSMDSIYTVASADVLKEIELEDGSDINDLENAVNDLVSATDDLIAGSDKLSDGLTTLKKNFKDYAGGVSDLNKGADDLKNGAGALATGVSQYTSGVKQITDGTGLYINGTKNLVIGLNTYVEGEKLIDAGAKTLADGANSFYKDTYQPFSNSLSQYFSAVSGENGLAAKTKALNQAVNSSDGEIAKGFSGSSAYLDAVSAQCQGSIEALNGLKQADNLTDEQKAAIDMVISSMESAGKAAGQAKQINGALQSKAGEGVTALNEGVQQLSENAKVLEGYNKQIASGMKGQLIGGISNLYDGIKKLSENNMALLNGAKSLETSGDSLTAGIAQLQKNATTLTSSADKLKKGAGSLSKGTSNLKKATKEVDEGVKSLQSGSSDLLSSLNQFKQKGTGKLQTEYNQNVKDVIERFKTLIERADDYRSFSGIADGMDGTVKFVFQTEEISMEE